MAIQVAQLGEDRVRFTRAAGNTVVGGRLRGAHGRRCDGRRCGGGGPIGERHEAGPTAVQVHGTELEAGGREVFRGIDEHELFQTEASGFDIPQAGPRPEVIDRKKKHDVVGEAEGVLEEAANLAPGRVGDDPVDWLLAGEEIAVSFHFTPRNGSSGSRIGCATRFTQVGAEGFEEVTITGAGFEDAAGGLEVLHEPAGERRGRRDRRC
jgi:hypothetical protein